MCIAFTSNVAKHLKHAKSRLTLSQLTIRFPTPQKSLTLKRTTKQSDHSESVLPIVNLALPILNLRFTTLIFSIAIAKLSIASNQSLLPRSA